MDTVFDRRHFIKMAGVGGVSMTLPSWAEKESLRNGNGLFPSFSKAGDGFSFVIFSDPQVGHANSDSRFYVNSRRTQIQAIQEINSMSPEPVFALFLGDLVNVPDRPSWDNFLDCVKEARMQKIWVHGNHDSRPPYDLYKEYQKADTGNDRMFFSWDIGKWHMIALPCNLDQGNKSEIEFENEMLLWLENDLRQNSHKPTMVFSHLHLTPAGLSPAEWYTFRLELRMKLLNILTAHGNVKWYFNGHIHGGIKTAAKLAKKYKGINFFTCPTIIEGKDFSEEFSEYEEGLSSGGYYSVVKIKGEEVQVEGRRVNVSKGYVFSNEFAEFVEEDEPRWFKKTVDFEANDKVVNGSFENDFTGWYAALRYVTDQHPAFDKVLDKTHRNSGDKSAFLAVRAKGNDFWGKDENNTLYQVVKAPDQGHPILNACYYLEKRPENGGGYIRVSAISQNEFKFLMMFNWGQNENRADCLPRCIGYEIYGVQQNWAFLSDLGLQRKALFWDINDDPGIWHNVIVDIADIYDRCIGEWGAYENLKITKFHLSLGTWSNPQHNSQSGACFDDIGLESSDEMKPSKVDNQLLGVNYHVFITRFGKDLKEEVDKIYADQDGRKLINPPKGEIKF